MSTALEDNIVHTAYVFFYLPYRICLSSPVLDIIFLCIHIVSFTSWNSGLNSITVPNMYVATSLVSDTQRCCCCFVYKIQRFSWTFQLNGHFRFFLLLCGFSSQAMHKKQWNAFYFCPSCLAVRLFFFFLDYKEKSQKSNRKVKTKKFS